MQSPQQPQPQLRYLLERGSNDPPSLVGIPAVASTSSGVVVSSSGGNAGGALITTVTSQPGNTTQQQQPLLSTQQGVTTSRVWVPGL